MELLLENLKDDAPRADDFTATKKIDYGFFKSGIVLNKIYFSEIIFIQSDHVHLNLFNTKEKKIHLRAKLDDVQSFLPSSRFQRIHQRYLVNIDCIDKITAESIFCGTKELPLSKKYKMALLAHLNIFSGS